MVDADDGGAGEFGQGHADEADWAGGGDVDDTWAVVFGGAEHSEEGRDGEVEGVVAGHWAGVDWGEVFDVGLVWDL